MGENFGEPYSNIMLLEGKNLVNKLQSVHMLSTFMVYL